MVDLYEESWGTHTWIDALDVDVHLLSIMEYRQILERGRIYKYPAYAVSDDISHYCGG